MASSFAKWDGNAGIAGKSQDPAGHQTGSAQPPPVPELTVAIITPETLMALTT